MAARSKEHKALGRSIREFRLEAGLSQERLGMDAGLDRTYVGGVERGERNPSYESLLRLARALGVKGSQILERAEGRRRG